MLKIDQLSFTFHSTAILQDIVMEVNDRSIVCLLGNNGSGKSTVLNAISGGIDCTGVIEWNHENIRGLMPKEIARRGIIHVLQGRRICPSLTVEENLEIGSAAWRGFCGLRSIRQDYERVYGFFPTLYAHRKQTAWSLSEGEQQILAIGRALMGRPKLLILDEPSHGLAPKAIDSMFEQLVKMNDEGMAILIAEQNARLSLEISDYAYVLQRGRVIMESAARELKHDERIIYAYLHN